MVAVLVDGREVDSAPGDGALVRLFRGVVAALREQNPDAVIDLPGGLANENDLIRDVSILIERRPARATAADGIDAVEDRAHARAMRGR